MSVATALFFLIFVFVTLTGLTRWSGRSLTLLDPTYAKKYIPIIASVSEHQPTSWSSYFFDLQHLMVFMPVGFYFCLTQKLTYGKLFIAIYGVLATYFSCVMIRLMLVLAPAACILAGIGVSELMRVGGRGIRQFLIHQKAKKAEREEEEKKKKGNKKIEEDTKSEKSLPVDMSFCLLTVLLMILATTIFHSTFVAAEAYSSPSIILASKRQDGSRVIIDDFREAYYWLKQNTDKDAKILSWWDYGY